MCTMAAHRNAPTRPHPFVHHTCLWSLLAAPFSFFADICTHPLLEPDKFIKEQYLVEYGFCAV